MGLKRNRKNPDKCEMQAKILVKNIGNAVYWSEI
jgi:hypothetical protein